MLLLMFQLALWICLLINFLLSFVYLYIIIMHTCMYNLLYTQLVAHCSLSNLIILETFATYYLTVHTYCTNCHPALTFSHL